MPSAPARAEQDAPSDLKEYSWRTGIRGLPPVFRFAMPETSPAVLSRLRDTLVVTIFAGAMPTTTAALPRSRPSSRPCSPRQAGSRRGAATAESGGLRRCHVVRRLPSAARRVRLASHLPALRAGHVTLAQIP